jgi:hypothetical protein
MPTVLIGGKPAARLSDMTLCTCTGGGGAVVGGGANFHKGKDGTCRGKPLIAQQAKLSCALACARMLGDGSKSEQDLVDEYGKPCTYKDGVPTPAGPYDPEHGTNFDDLPGIIKFAGGGDAKSYDPTGKELADKQADGLDHIQKCGGPCIVGVDNGDAAQGGAPEVPPKANHAVIVDGVKNGMVLVRDPFLGAPAGCQAIPISQFKKRFDPRAGITCVGK